MDCHFLSISELGAGYRAGEFSPVEVVDALLERIEQYGNQSNAYITVTAERARAEAKAAEAMLGAGADLGPLHGIPIGLKDLLHTAGIRTTWGARALEHFVPDNTATVAQRLAQAGAVLMGKVNMVELAFGPYGLNPHYGTSLNPWDAERVPGGSSSGSATAVAMGLAAATLGTDTGGSIRGPASFCGVVGLKPTLERVSRAGAMPLSWTLDSIGPLACSVEDAALVFAAIAGADAADPVTLGQPVLDVLVGLKRGAKGMRVGLVRDPFFEEADAEVVAAVEAAASVLEELGASIVDFALPEAREELDEEMAGRGSLTIMPVEGYACHRNFIAQHGEQMDERIRARIEHGASIAAPDYAAVLQRRAELRRSVVNTLREVDAVICPTTLTPAPRIADVDVAPVRLTARLVNFLGLCAVSVPCGLTADNLPIGLQIIGKPFDEASILQLGYAYEQAAQKLRPPGF